MQTSDPNIYAIGDCAEHRGTIYGTVSPGFEQAAIVAHHIARRRPVRYPDVAVAPVCVSCHNKHADTPKSDFKIGEVMGGVVIRIPL